MDTDTYPKVGDLAGKFVCVRVDHDKNRELVKRYGVKSLPDVRLFSPDGRELAKFVGRTSPEKLGGAMKLALEGKSAAERPAAPGRRNVELTEGAMKVAVRQ